MASADNPEHRFDPVTINGHPLMSCRRCNRWWDDPVHTWQLDDWTAVQMDAGIVTYEELDES